MFDKIGFACKAVLKISQEDFDREQTPDIIASRTLYTPDI